MKERETEKRVTISADVYTSAIRWTSISLRKNHFVIAERTDVLPPLAFSIPDNADSHPCHQMRIARTTGQRFSFLSLSIVLTML